MAPQKTQQVNFITGNKFKLAEVRAILGDTIEIRSQSTDLPEIQGTHREIAIAKCLQAAIAVDGPALVEDTALNFSALNGMPGPYIKDFYNAMGNDGLYSLIAAYVDKSATSVCILAFSPGPGEKPILFEGRTVGRLVPARGNNGFAYDPIFEFEGQTYAEMDTPVKNKVSDRYKALMKLKDWLEGGKIS